MVGSIVVGKSPINQAQVSLWVINNDVEWLHVAMHDTVRVGKLESFQCFVDVQPDVHVVELAS